MVGLRPQEMEDHRTEQMISPDVAGPQTDRADCRRNRHWFLQVGQCQRNGSALLSIVILAARLKEWLQSGTRWSSDKGKREDGGTR